MIPTQEQVAYVNKIYDELQARARSIVASGEHIDDIAEMVHKFNDDPDGPTAGVVAGWILTYLSDRIVMPFSLGELLTDDCNPPADPEAKEVTG